MGHLRYNDGSTHGVLETEVVIGLAIGCSFVIVLCIGIIAGCCIYRCRKNRRRDDNASPLNNVPSDLILMPPMSPL